MSNASPPISGDDKGVPTLNELRDVSDEQVGAKVQEAEGLEAVAVNVVQSTRHMQFYSVSESELRQLSLVNNLVAFAWAVVSGTGLFVLDVIKDVLLADSIPESAIGLASRFWPLLLFFLLAALLGLVLAYRWRGNLIHLIKTESRDGTLGAAETRSGRLRLQKPWTRG